MSVPHLEIVELNEHRLVEFQPLRLRALREEPTAFALSPAEVEAFTEADWRRHLSPEAVMFCGYYNGRLVGSAGLTRERSAKKSHKYILVAVYVEPESRSSGIGRALVRHALNVAFHDLHAAAVKLTVTDHESAAANLYLSLGFEVWGREPDALHVGDKYYDDLHMQISREEWLSREETEE